MRGKEILRLVDVLHRQKDIDEEIIFRAIESALQSAARKHFGSGEDVTIEIDRDSGEVKAYRGETLLDPEALGRIAAQTAKQVIIQKIGEAENETIYDEYIGQRGNLVTGAVQRIEGGNIVVDLGRTEGILPRSEQTPGERYQPGERIRAVIVDVKKSGQRVLILLSRTHPDFIRRLFELEVPEIGDNVVEIIKIAREAGLRSKIAVRSHEARVDCIGACVGIRGTRIKSIIDELDGEKVDIISWNEAPEILIANTLRPAEILQITLEEGENTKRAIVTVPEDQLSLAIGRRGQNVRLAVKLTGWDIDIQAPESAEAEEEEAEGVEEAPQEDPAEQESQAEEGGALAEASEDLEAPQE